MMLVRPRRDADLRGRLKAHLTSDFNTVPHFSSHEILHTRAHTPTHLCAICRQCTHPRPQCAVRRGGDTPLAAPAVLPYCPCSPILPAACDAERSRHNTKHARYENVKVHINGVKPSKRTCVKVMKGTRRHVLGLAVPATCELPAWPELPPRQQ